MIEQFWQKYQRQILIGGGGIIIVLLVSVILRLTFFSQETPATENLADAEVRSELSSEESKEEEVVAFADIKGAVVSPGMYQITENTRLQDLIALAGGLTREAEPRHLNLALLIQDQMSIYIPSVGEDYSSEEVEIADPNQKTDKQKKDGVNLNTADVSELQKLNGIGPKKAEAIIAYREEVGSFKSLEELKEVSGIGEKTFENIKEDITIK